MTSREEFSEADPSISLPESRKMKYFQQFHSFPMTTDQQGCLFLIETPVTPPFFGHSQENSGKKQKKGRRTDAIPTTLSTGRRTGQPATAPLTVKVKGLVADVGSSENVLIFCGEIQSGLSQPDLDVNMVIVENHMRKVKSVKRVKKLKFSGQI
ncbi:MAG: hypothetical protein FWC50_00180 [Planctomycetaceae bacterium]|nr:hypothetical protein [Planctomycetaceae bacterium]